MIEREREMGRERGKEGKRKRQTCMQWKILYRYLILIITFLPCIEHTTSDLIAFLIKFSFLLT